VSEDHRCGNASVLFARSSLISVRCALVSRCMRCQYASSVACAQSHGSPPIAHVLPAGERSARMRRRVCITYRSPRVDRPRDDFERLTLFTVRRALHQHALSQCPSFIVFIYYLSMPSRTRFTSLCSIAHVERADVAREANARSRDGRMENETRFIYNCRKGEITTAYL
jgi:hypothetical protein